MYVTLVFVPLLIDLQAHELKLTVTDAGFLSMEKNLQNSTAYDDGIYKAVSSTKYAAWQSVSFEWNTHVLNLPPSSADTTGGS